MVKKQEAEAATTTPPEEETLEQCMARHMANDPELTEEAARAACEAERKKPEPPAPAEGGGEAKGFMDKIMAVFDEAMKKRFDEFWKQVEKRMDEVLEKTQEQAVQSLRKGLGISEDPVIHLSEMPELVRKIMLELKPHGKKSETATPDKPAAGSEEKPRIPKAEDRFKEMLDKRLGP